MKDHSDGATGAAPIFIVGVPRSGTTLLSALLSAHPNLSCGTETHFFEALGKANHLKLINRSSWPDNAVDFLFAIRDEGRPVPENYGLTRQDIHIFLENSEPSIVSMLEALTVQHMHKVHKKRWIEKTPNHIACIPLIRKYFPDAPIIHIVRDPRDVALSIVAAPWEWAPRSFEGALALWLYYEDLAKKAVCEDDRIYTIRYEDLVSKPEKYLRELCNCISEEFSSDMLDTSESAKHVNSLNESWKIKVSDVIDQGRAAVWKSSLTSDQIRNSAALLSEYLGYYSYPVTDRPDKRMAIFPVYNIRKYSELIGWAGRNGYCLMHREGGSNIDNILFIGDPSKDGWFPDNRYKRILLFVWLVTLIMKAQLMKAGIKWYTRHEVPVRSRGLAIPVLYYMLRKYKIELS